jgi:hypothetical protein
MRGLFSIVFIFCALLGSSQRLIGADAVTSKTAVTIRFTLAAGTSCSSYSILHCIDSVSYQEIFSGGQCDAEPTVPKQVTYAHTSFVPDVVNYYKVRLDAWETSSTIRVFPSKTGRSGLTMFPNPMGPSDRLLNLNAFGTNNTKLWGFLYTRFGEPKQELSFETSGQRAQLNVGDLEQGVYVVWLTDGSNVFSGKVIVLD